MHIIEAIARPRNAAPVVALELERTIVPLANRETAFVQQTVVVRAQQRQVIELGPATVRPVLEMMRIDIVLAVATRKGAAAIAREQRFLQRRRDHAAFASQRQRPAVVVLDECDQVAVAAQTPHRLERQVRTARPSMEGFLVDVDDDLIVICNASAGLS